VVWGSFGGGAVRERHLDRPQSHWQSRRISEIWNFLAMSRLFIFADEAGCFNFTRNPGASRYYIVCTISCSSCSALGSSLLELRRSLVWEGAPIGEYFHATEDKQIVRDRVFETLKQNDFCVQATIMEKSKALARIRPTPQRFYQYGWFYHFKYAAPKIIKGVKELQITTASVGTARDQGVFSFAVRTGAHAAL
jgi:hypothetical protein